MVRKQTALRPYFEKMSDIGKPLSPGEIKRTEENIKFIQEQEDIISGAVEKVKNAGTSAEVIRKRGQMTVWDRLDYLVFFTYTL